MNEPSGAAPGLTLLGRPGCGLCDEMAEELHHALEGRAVAIVSTDVDDDPVLRRRFGLRIPVLLDEWSDVICEGRFDGSAFAGFTRRFDAWVEQGGSAR